MNYYDNEELREMNKLLNEKIEKQILKIYKDSKNRYGAIKINESLKAVGINISLKRTQRLMKKLEIKSIIIKKYKPASSKKKIEEKENDFKSTTIN